MTRSVSLKLAIYSSFAAAAFLLALVLGRPELAALGAPFAAYLVLALALVTPPDLDVRFCIDAERTVEGETVEASVEISARSAVHEVELLPALPPGLRVGEGASRMILRLARGQRKTVPLAITADHWGLYRVGEVAVRVRDRFGLVSFDARVPPAVRLRVYPRTERLLSLVRPLETQPYAGNRVARAKGEGIEFADIRPFVPGDHVRRVNWRASARKQALYVNEAHPERNSDVVLFLDSFAEVRLAENGTLDLAVRAAASLANEYLQVRDRVGVVGFGAIVNWLTPSMGRRQLYRITDALLQTEVMLSFAWKNIDVLPPRSLPPQALVIALSPMLDERSLRAMLDLRARGFDLVVVDVSPLPFADAPDDQIDELARRLWRLWRDALRYRYEQLGVAVVEWNEQKPLLQVIEEVRRFRRSARRAYA